MSNQRKGKYQSRPDVGGQDMNMLKFFKTAQKVLEREINKTKHLTLNKW